MVVLPVLFLLGSLFLCGQAHHLPEHVQSSTVEMLKHAALQMPDVTCKAWDCNCTYTRQRGCCCAAQDMYDLEEETFIRIKYLWHYISKLKYAVHGYTECSKVAFKAAMDPNLATTAPGSTDRCFGPFNTNVPIPYGMVSLNHHQAYNPAMGVFTCPCAGVYQFSYTIYSYVQKGERLYHKVQLMKNGMPMVSVWENNREDHEDSATQVVIVEMKAGDQVYMEMMSGRKLCKHVEYNIFTGFMLYPDVYDHDYGYPYGYEYDYEYEHEPV